jgi:hypothetical protein
MATSIKAKNPIQKEQHESETPNATHAKVERLGERAVEKRRDQSSEQKPDTRYDRAAD